MRVQQNIEKNKKTVSSDGWLPNVSEEHTASTGRQGTW